MVDRYRAVNGGIEKADQGGLVYHDDYEALERQIAELRAERDSWLEASIKQQKRAHAAEAENARLKALPLKDEVERVLDAIIDAPGTWEDKVKTAQSLANDLLSRLRAGEQEGWQIIGYARAIDVDTAERPFEGKTSFWVSERQTPYYSVPVYLPAAPSEHGGEYE